MGKKIIIVEDQKHLVSSALLDYFKKSDYSVKLLDIGQKISLEEIHDFGSKNIVIDLGIFSDNFTTTMTEDLKKLGYKIYAFVPRTLCNELSLLNNYDNYEILYSGYSSEKMKKIFEPSVEKKGTKLLGTLMFFFLIIFIAFSLLDSYSFYKSAKTDQTFIQYYFNDINYRIYHIINSDSYSREYIVREGETVYSISKKLGISLSEFLRINNLKETSTIKPGQILKY
ncbi:MAG: LysM peptidoglycan-binding domain-containing protein [Thermotogae bacterium]|nr:LysM peptidoglycan-binding domain-containing protein [Thermotogota bacterium]MCP5465990.1 LysM peptidoglycan-binding domain-containing protein [Thermotogota bacterium]HOO74202.1 LysM domain-containing protein [Tepiditoga sp.]